MQHSARRHRPRVAEGGGGRRRWELRGKQWMVAVDFITTRWIFPVTLPRLLISHSNLFSPHRHQRCGIYAPMCARRGTMHTVEATSRRVERDHDGRRQVRRTDQTSSAQHDAFGIDDGSKMANKKVHSVCGSNDRRRHPQFRLFARRHPLLLSLQKRRKALSTGNTASYQPHKTLLESLGDMENPPAPTIRE